MRVIFYIVNRWRGIKARCLCSIIVSNFKKTRLVFYMYICRERETRNIWVSEMLITFLSRGTKGSGCLSSSEKVENFSGISFASEKNDGIFGNRTRGIF